MPSYIKLLRFILLNGFFHGFGDLFGFTVEVLVLAAPFFVVNVVVHLSFWV